MSDASGATNDSWFVGVDVGGTFTDIVLADASGELHVDKVPTTPEDPRVGVVEGIRRVLDHARVSPSALTRVVHGTTLATNVILERKGGPIAFVVTEGFADLLRLGREARVEDDRYDLFFTTPAPPVDPRLTFEVNERVAADGRVLAALATDAARELAARVAATRPTAVAVCFLNAYANPDHERAVAAALREALPETFVVTSTEVWPEMREYERAMTTVMCAYVGPVMAGYLTGLAKQLAELGVTGALEIMDSAGGVMSASLAARRPVRTLESGGAAGVTAAGLVGRLVGAPAVISFDMGGTTAKAGIVRDGRPAVVNDFQVGGKGSFGGTRAGTGFPVKIPTVDLAEVGAGGGSIAWIDAGGALRVGPQSAGAVPGPACYERGGTEPTVTDANLVLGYLDPAGLAGGVTLSVDVAVDALARSIADPLGIDVAAAARGVHDIVNASMAAAIRVVTVQRGIDPRAFTLVAFGGAGPMHAVRLAEMFGITTVVVPPAAGVGSAVGLVGADLGVELVQTRVVDLHDADADELEAAFAELTTQARAELADEPGATFSVTRSADVRYRGQAYHLTVPVPTTALTAADLATLAQQFRDRYAEAYGISLDHPTQVHNIRVHVVRVVEKLTPRSRAVDTADASSAMVGQRDAVFPSAGAEPVRTALYDRALLHAGHRFTGPAVVAATESTIVVPPRTRADVDTYGNVVLTLEGS
jgi:N-methylhydantoinase A